MIGRFNFNKFNEFKKNNQNWIPKNYGIPTNDVNDKSEDEKEEIKEEVKNVIHEASTELQSKAKTMAKEAIKESIKKMPLSLKLKIIGITLLVLAGLFIILAIFGPIIGAMLDLTGGSTINASAANIPDSSIPSTDRTNITNPGEFPVFIQNSSANGGKDQWAYLKYASGDHATMASAGCGVFSTSMVMAGLDSSITPPTVLQAINNAGKLGPHQDTTTIPWLWNEAFKNLGYKSSVAKYDALNLDNVDKILASGGFIIKDYHGSFFNDWGGGAGHYVAIVGGNQTNGYVIRDSGWRYHTDNNGKKYTMATDLIPASLVNHHTSGDYYYEITPTSPSTSSSSNYKNLSSTRQSLLTKAEQAIGGKYVWGGDATSPELEGIKNGVDCSGFVSWLLWGTYGDSTQWTTETMKSAIGNQFIQINETELKPGDIGLNRTSSGGHTGVYAGNGLWIHASTESVGIIKNSQTFTYYLRYYKEKN